MCNAQSVLNNIPFGSENAISRKDLAEKLGLGDRTMRLRIEAARDEGYIIINLQDGEGYYQSNEVKDIWRQFKQDHARAMSILKRLKFLYRRLKAAGEVVNWKEAIQLRKVG